MARLHQRIIALAIAILFFVTAAGAAAALIWEVAKNKEDTAVNDNANADTNDTTSPQDSQSQNILQGTPLANFTPQQKIDELQTIDTKAGTGKEVKPGDTVTVDYTGAIASTGVIFQSSLDRGEPISFSLDGVIVGWKEGVPGMKEGGVRRLLIPASMAYGANPPEGIPPNADLVFDITLHKVGE